jgi:FK506-binding protein 4/5
VKRVYREGSGDDCPPAGSKVIVHYVGTLASDGSKFDSSRDRDSPFEFTLGQGQVIAGWDKGVATMKIGELAQLECASDMAYGDQGSPPSIPGGATLNFEVELIDFNDKENVTEDGKVRKKTMREGDGYESPELKKGATDMKLIMTARVGNPQGAIFFQATEPTVVTFEDPVMSYGLETTLAAMKRGEHCKVWVHAEYGMGPKGNADLKIPPDSALYYDVELVSFARGFNDWEMTLLQKMDQADAMKAVANSRLQARQYTWAMKTYEDAIEVLRSLTDAEGDELKRMTALRIALYNNAAMCGLLMKHYAATLEACEEVLALDSQNEKAMLRKGQALFRTEEYEAAAQALRAAKALHPNNAEITKYLNASRTKLKKIAERERKLYGNMFG